MRSPISIRGQGFLSFVRLFLALSTVAFAADAARPDRLINVSHAPKQPKTGDQVVIAVEVPHPLKADDLVKVFSLPAGGDLK